MFCCTLLYVHSSIAIILMGKRELDALLNLSSWCLVMVAWLFLAVPWGCLRFVIVVFPDHSHLLFLIINGTTLSLFSIHLLEACKRIFCKRVKIRVRQNHPYHKTISRNLHCLPFLYKKKFKGKSMIWTVNWKTIQHEICFDYNL